MDALAFSFIDYMCVAEHVQLYDKSRLTARDLLLGGCAQAIYSALVPWSLSEIISFLETEGFVICEVGKQEYHLIVGAALVPVEIVTLRRIVVLSVLKRMALQYKKLQIPLSRAHNNSCTRLCV